MIKCTSIKINNVNYIKHMLHTWDSSTANSNENPWRILTYILPLAPLTTTHTRLQLEKYASKHMMNYAIVVKRKEIFHYSTDIE